VGRTPNLPTSGEHSAEFYREMWETLRSGAIWEGQIVNRRKDGTLYTEHATISPVRDFAGRIVNFVAVKRDITQQLHDQRERENLQNELVQAQKMESIGRLAGGVAHDFNNMLQAILGYTDMALEQVPAGQPLHNDLLEIQKAAQRSAALTRQLQVFARKQAMAPKVLDLNQAVEGMFSMLRRLIGEDIQLDWKPGADLGSVKIDPSQLDQIVANLCVNARDAIEKTGHIIIETRNADIDRFGKDLHGGIEPGSYVLLAVSDNGCGMSPEVLGHLFEPFFTTKPLGKGTGLGLSTVYGIVKQNGGGIQVYSEPGRGSTFKIYLPRLGQTAEAAPADESQDPASRAHETILLVEDEESILQTSRRMLESLGYQVLATNSPATALRLAEGAGGDNVLLNEYADRIDLLITDVIMPEMNGPELVERLQARFPRLKHLFMSGYTANLIAVQGVQTGKMDFIQKPFSRTALAQKVREILDRK
jgi:signal transduction histidine kinase/CheY-like chemotaxis protein